MAEQTAIDAVKLELPDATYLTEFGLDDTIIGGLLDSGLTQTGVLLTTWRVIAAKTALATDVSESGSSRNFSQLNTKAMAMVTHFQMLSDREDVLQGTNSRQRFNSYTATRV
jgi:hypothetical protein